MRPLPGNKALMVQSHPGKVIPVYDPAIDGLATGMSHRAVLSINSTIAQYSDYTNHADLTKEWTDMGDIKIGTGGYKADSIAVSQNLIAALSTLSDGNCFLQQQVDPAGYSFRTRLWCKKCSAVDQAKDVMVLTSMAEHRLLQQYEAFCVEHRHAQDPKGYVGHTVYSFKGSVPQVAAVPEPDPYRRKYRSDE